MGFTVIIYVFKCFFIKLSATTKIDKYIEICNNYSNFSSYDLDSEKPDDSFYNGGVNFRYFLSNNCGISNINNHSIVVIIEYMGAKIIIPGDNEASSWNELLKIEDFKNAISGTNVFIASHHGRESGYCAELFNHFTPNIVIVSDDSEVDTSVTNRYTAIASGWDVKKRSNEEYINRKCLTTRNDGCIAINIERNYYTNKTHMEVTIN